MRHPAHPDYHRTLFNSVLHEPLTAVAVMATALQAAGTIMSGNAARGQANYEAAQMTQQAGQERASSQREAIEHRRQAGLANSRVQAVAAASGAGASDPTVINIEKDNAGIGEFNALSSLYHGEEKARGLEMNARGTQYAGQQARQASVFKAGSTILSAGSSMYEKYGQGGPTKTGSMFDPQVSSLPWQNTPGYTVPNYR